MTTAKNKTRKLLSLLLTLCLAVSLFPAGALAANTEKPIEWNASWSMLDANIWYLNGAPLADAGLLYVEAGAEAAALRDGFSKLCAAVQGSAAALAAGDHVSFTWHCKALPDGTDKSFRVDTETCAKNTILLDAATGLSYYVYYSESDWFTGWACDLIPTFQDVGTYEIYAEAAGGNTLDSRGGDGSVVTVHAVADIDNPTDTESKTIRLSLAGADGEFLHATRAGATDTKLLDLPLTVGDLNLDGSITVEDAFLALHTDYSAGGAADFGLTTSELGDYVSRLWGVDFASAGYYLNHSAATLLSSPLTEGDVLRVFFYQDTLGWSDVYTWFASEAAATVGSAATLTLSYDTGWDGTATPAGALVRVYAESGAENPALATTVGADGSFRVTFPATGRYTVRVRSAADVWVVPADGSVLVSRPGGGGTDLTIRVQIKTHESSRCGSGASPITLMDNPGAYTNQISRSVTLSPGSTVYDALAAATSNFTELSSGYISAISGLAEGAHGSNSGWLYMVNGVAGTISCRNYTLVPGDTVVWWFTDDFTSDTGSEQWSGGSSSGVSAASVAPPVVAATPSLAETAAWVLKTIPAPVPGSVGGEWAVLGLARAGITVPAGYYEGYCAALETALTTNKLDSTDIARAVLALTAIGRDPRNVGGQNLLLSLEDFDVVTRRGLNSVIFTLLALDSGDYAVSSSTIRARYVEKLLSYEHEGGGFSLTGKGTPDADLTAMALTALARYREQSAVSAAMDRALAYLAARQESDGGFGTAESAAQVVVALCTLGLPLDDARFVKNGKNPLDALLAYTAADGGVAHTAGGAADAMAAEQTLYALAAVQRAARSEAPLYDMRAVAVSEPVFSDIEGHANRAAIEALAGMGIVNGMGDGSFRPNASLTRAELATILVRALDLAPEIVDVFTDVAPGAWYAPYVGAAYTRGLVRGVGGGLFEPDGTVTVRMTEIMLARAAAALGLSREEPAWSDSAPILRGEAAQGLYDLLREAGRIQQEAPRA